jgi:3-isopropylmalate dehydrogenase
MSSTRWPPSRPGHDAGYLGESAAAQAVDKAVTTALNCGKIKSLAAGRMGLGTTEVGDLVAGLV